MKSRMLIATAVLLLALVAASASADDDGAKKPSSAEFVVDSEVETIKWLDDKKTVFVLTAKKTLYRSADEGRTWTSQMSSLPAPEGEKKEVRAVEVNPIDTKKIFLRGTGTTNWCSSNGGKTWKQVKEHVKVDDIKFHPKERNTFLFSSLSDACFRQSDGETTCTKRLYLTKDFGHTVSELTSHVVQYDWPRVYGKDVTKSTIFASRHSDKTSSQKFGSWDPGVDFVRTDDNFKTEAVLLQGGNKFVFMDKFLFVATVNEHSTVTLMVSLNNGAEWEASRLPYQNLYQHSYTILDTSEGAAFLHVNHGHAYSRWGHIYTSDASGTTYALSLTNNKRDYSGRCDFEKVEGIEGVYLANWVGDTNEEAFSDDQLSLKTAITFDKGGDWHYLLPPDVDAEGKPIKCTRDDDDSYESCYLHLHGTTADMGPFYSTESAIGLIIANGNVGTRLKHRSDETNVYLSRDAGLRWKEIRKGPHIYEFGNHGGIIVMAPTDHATDTLLYSLTQGKDWHEYKFTSDLPVEVENIVIEPSSTSQTFVVYGTRSGDSDTHNNGVLLHLDFASLHERKCKNIETAGSEDSDYEKWVPVDQVNGPGSDKCLLGHKVTYTRRKAAAPCYNPEKMEKKVVVANCPCRQEDWECDFGYTREVTDANRVGSCVKEAPPMELAPEQAAGDGADDATLPADPLANCEPGATVFVTHGYRRVAGNTCDHLHPSALNLGPDELRCPGGGSSRGWIVFFIVLVLGALMAAGIMMNKNGKCRGFFFSQLDSFRYQGIGTKPDMLSDDEFGLGDDDDDDAEVLHDGALLSFNANDTQHIGPLDALPGAQQGAAVPTLSGPPAGNVLDDFNPRNE